MAENNVDISQVTIEVEAEASAAGRSIDSLASALSRLNSNSKLTRIINNLDKLSATLQKFQGLNASANALAKISVAVDKLSGLQKLTGLNSALNTLRKFPEVVSGLDPARLTAFSNAVAPLSKAVGDLGDVQKLSGLNSVLNTLKKIPDVTAGLKKADLDDFAEQIQKVRAAVAPLASEMEKVSKGFSALPANIQKAIAANQRLTTSNKSTSNSYNILGLSISKTQLNFTGMVLAMRQLAQFLGGALTSFNAYVENVNLFSVSMGRFAETGRDAVQTMQDVLGVDMSEAMRNMGVLQNLTTSFGVLDSQAYVLSKNLTQLGYDMASFFNIDTASAFEKLQAAISGELEPIRRLGVDISEARLQQELYNLGIDASVKSLSQADKALLRYIAIMDQTSNAQTDMARTLNSPANMIRVFQAQVTLLVRSIGSLLIPMLNALLPPLIAATQILREVISAIASFIGVDIQFADVGSSVGSSVGNITSGLDDVTESANAAADAVSYLIGGFDELNVLPSQSSAAAAGDTGTGSILGGITLPEYDMFEGLTESKVSKWVEKLRGPLTMVLGLVGAIGAGILAWKVGSALYTGLTFVKGLLTWISGGTGGLLTIKAIAPEIASALSAIGPTVALAAGAVAVMVTRFIQLYASSETFRQGLENIWGVIKSIGEGLWDGLMKGLEPARQAIVDLGNQILDLVPESWRQPIMDFFEAMLPDALHYLNLALGDVIITLAGIGLMFVPGGQIVGVALLAFETISLRIRALGLLTDGQMTAVKNAFKTAFEWIGNIVGGIISGVVTYITTKLSGIITFLTGVFTGNWRQAFQGISDFSSAIFQGIASFIDSVFGWDIVQSVKNAINSLVSYFNRFIGWLNGRLNISYGGLSVLGQQVIPAFNIQLASIPSIPYLADGGVLTGPQLVMAGEYSGAATNPEIVTPQNIMRETMVDANEEMAVAIVTAIQALQRAVEEKDQNVYITESDVGRAAAHYGQQQRRRTGKNPFATA